MNKRKICVVSGTRAEYGLFYPILKEIEKSSYLQLQLVVSTMHLSAEFGNTYKQIESDGFHIDEKIENLFSSDTKSAIAKSTGMATVLLSATFERIKPNCVLLLGDRFETHAAATTAMLMNIPIAHIHGGEITEGAVDEQIRHSITKMSYIHFTSTQSYKNRIIQMGEADNRVYNVGAPGIDNIVNMKMMSREEIEKDLEWSMSDKCALFTYHSETLSNSNIIEDIETILAEIEKSDFNVLFTYANADEGGRVINRAVEKFVMKNKKRYHVVKSLGQLRYLSVMKEVNLLIGNTSSGIIEAASFQKPVVNIGDRQKGRLQSNNVIDCDVTTFNSALKKALSIDFNQECKNVKNIYGDGKSASRIVQVLESKNLSSIKGFCDL